MKLVYMLLGVAIGIGLRIAWERITEEPIMVDGILQMESPTHPAVTPLYPSGCFIESRIYLPDEDTNHVGKRITTWATLGVTKESQAPRYPMVKKRMR